MDQGISISTPESLEFSHEPAGIGSRFVASIIDSVLQAAMMLGLISTAGLWAVPLASIADSSAVWGSALMILLFFLKNYLI